MAMPSSRKSRFLFGNKIQDTLELEPLCDLVVSRPEQWNVAKLSIERVDANYR